MKLSVVICTWNRAQSLSRLLRSLTQAEPPLHADWEIIIVNNNCTDDTDLIVGQYSHVLPLKRVFESKPGQSHARNAGVAAASGDYFLWTDDDVTVGRNWLRSYEAAFERWPETAVFGGPITPHFEGNPPNWIGAGKHSILKAYAGINIGKTRLMFDAASRDLPYGANYAVRGLEQRQFRYDTRLGRRPGPSIIGFDETDLLKRILATGKTGWWLPGTMVKHWIPPSRQTTHYLRAYFRGIGQVLASSIVLPCRPQNGYTRAKLYFRAVVLEMVYRYQKQVSQPDKWLLALEHASVTWGRLTGFSRIPRT